MRKIHNDTFMMLLTIGCLFGFGLTHMLTSFKTSSIDGLTISFVAICTGVVLCFKIDKLDQHFKNFEKEQEDF